MSPHPHADATRDRPTGSFGVAILGLGTYLPDEVVTNDDLAATLDTSDEWIRARTGIEQRHRAATGEATSDIAVEAARRALDDAGLVASDVKMVLLATSTPDYKIAACAPMVAAKLGIDAPAMDLNAACSGFVYGLQAATGMVTAGTAPILLIGAETMTRIVDPSDRSVSILFGDGGGAVVLGPDENAELGPFDLGSDGADPSGLYIEAGGSAVPVDAEMIDDRRHFLTMRGREIYRFAIANMSASSQRVLDQADLTVDDVDLFVGHQANIRILNGVAAQLGVPADRCHTTVNLHGNTSSASIPLCLGDARDHGRLPDGTRVLLTAFGAGLTWGSTLLTWRNP
ncbi:MAG TPA: beta-ketoacyl-ACP synthase III [Nitriliruptoraceae bacterium]|nr:beta-ketoacyl-ACP synthase III [Nitriliruptoraceae bacterium]